MEVVVRLKSVTPGCPAQELSLKRNAIGQLGFHVQPDGVVTQVENMGLAWQAGLRQGARLVEVRRFFSDQHSQKRLRISTCEKNIAIIFRFAK